MADQKERKYPEQETVSFPKKKDEVRPDQSERKLPELEIAPTPEKRYDLKGVESLQRLVKRKISFNKTWLKTFQWGSINIPRKSKENLKKVKERLQQCAFLPTAEQKQLQSEKKSAASILTPQERKLFAYLTSKKKYVLHHTTSAKLIKDIFNQVSPALLDPQEVKRRGGPPPHTATPDFGGINQNVFFGFGTKSSSIPFFLRDRKEDYSTIKVDLDSLLADKKLARGVWCSGHFAHYELIDNFGILLPSIQPIEVGNSQFNWEYKFVRANGSRIRELIEGDKLIKYLNFVRADGSRISQPIDLDGEIAAGEDLKGFFAYSFIERLRFVGGDVRKDLLLALENNPQLVDKIVDFLIEKLFRVDDFEVHLPTKLALDRYPLEVMTPQKRKEITTKVTTTAKNGDTKALDKLLEEGYPLEGYMYEDRYYDDDSPPLDLPLVAAIKAKQQGVIDWLIEHKVNEQVFREEKRGKKESIEILSAINILAAAFEAGDLGLVQFLVAKGLDINLYYNSELIKGSYLDSHNDELKLAASDEDAQKTDLTFIAALHALAKNSSLKDDDLAKLLDYFVANSKYIKVSPERIFADIARKGDEKTFNYFLKKYHELPIDYVKLFWLAIENNNYRIVPFLFNKCKALRGTFLVDEKESEKLEGGFSYSLKNGQFEIARLFLKTFPAHVNLKRIGSTYLSQVEFRGLMGLPPSRHWEKCVRFCVDELGSELSYFNIHSLSRSTTPETIKWLIDRKFLTLSEVFRDTVRAGNFEFADYLLKEHKELQEQKMEPFSLDSFKWLDDRGLINDAYFSKKNEVSNLIACHGNNNNIGLVERLVEKAKQRGGYAVKSIFNEAIAQNNPAILTWLKTKENFNPNDLVITSYQCVEHISALRWLLENGLNPNIEVKGYGDLVTALLNKKSYRTIDIKKLKVLSEYGCSKLDEFLTQNPEALDSFENDLGLYLVDACEINSTIIFKRLLQNGRKLYVYPYQTSFNRTELHVACQRGNAEIIKLLLDAGAKLNVGRRSPLSLLCSAKVPNLDLVRLLLSRGAEINYGTKVTPLASACTVSQPNPQLIELLLENGADPFWIVPNQKKSIIHLLVERSSPLVEVFVRQKVQHYIDVRSKGAEYIGIFGSYLGFSKNEKLTAARVLLEEVKQGRLIDLNANIVLKPYKEILSKGELGDVTTKIQQMLRPIAAKQNYKLGLEYYNGLNRAGAEDFETFFNAILSLLNTAKNSKDDPETAKKAQELLKQIYKNFSPQEGQTEEEVIKDYIKTQTAERRGRLSRQIELIGRITKGKTQFDAKTATEQDVRVFFDAHPKEIALYAQAQFLVKFADMKKFNEAKAGHYQFFKADVALLPAKSREVFSNEVRRLELAVRIKMAGSESEMGAFTAENLTLTEKDIENYVRKGNKNIVEAEFLPQDLQDKFKKFIQDNNPTVLAEAKLSL